MLSFEWCKNAYILTKKMYDEEEEEEEEEEEVMLCKHRLRYSRERALHNLVDVPGPLPLPCLDSLLTARSFFGPGSVHEVL